MVKLEVGGNPADSWIPELAARPEPVEKATKVAGMNPFEMLSALEPKLSGPVSYRSGRAEVGSSDSRKMRYTGSHRPGRAAQAVTKVESSISVAERRDRRRTRRSMKRAKRVFVRGWLFDRRQKLMAAIAGVGLAVLCSSVASMLTIWWYTGR